MCTFCLPFLTTQRLGNVYVSCKPTTGVSFYIILVQYLSNKCYIYDNTVHSFCSLPQDFYSLEQGPNHWLLETDDYLLDRNPVMYLVGNKTDMEQARMINAETAKVC